MVHLVFSNLKAWLAGTHHGVSVRQLPAYLNEFVFRFNRRFYPLTAVHSVLGIGMKTAGPTYDGLYDGGWDLAYPLDAPSALSAGVTKVYLGDDAVEPRCSWAVFPDESAQSHQLRTLRHVQEPPPPDGPRAR